MEQLLLEFALRFFGNDTLSDVVALEDEQIHVPFGIAHGFQRKVDAMQSPIRPRMSPQIELPVHSLPCAPRRAIGSADRVSGSTRRCPRFSSQ